MILIHLSSLPMLLVAIDTPEFTTYVTGSH